MDENIRAFFDCRACRLQFGRVHCDADFVRMTFFNCRAHDRPEAFDRMILIDDVPNLHQIGFLLGEFAHEFSRLIGRVDLDDRRIAEIEFLARDTRDQWAGHRDARRFRRCVCSFPHFEIPKWSADIDTLR